MPHTARLGRVAGAGDGRARGWRDGVAACTVMHSRDPASEAAQELLAEALAAGLRRAGPRADAQALSRYIGAPTSAQRNVAWGVNTYLRDEVERCADAGGVPHWMPRRASRPTDGGGGAGGGSYGIGTDAAAASAPPESIDVGSLPAACVSAIVASMEHFEDALLAAEVCRAWRDAARSDAVWLAHFARRFGASPEPHPAGPVRANGAVPASEGTSPRTEGPRALALAAFRECFERELAQRCPRCGEGTLRPIIYGYPRPKLLKARSRGLCVLGGDQLIPSAPCWACAPAARDGSAGRFGFGIDLQAGLSDARRTCCMSAWAHFPIGHDAACSEPRIDHREEWIAFV